MTRISTSELYNNRNLIKQLCDIKDQLDAVEITDIAFTRAAEIVTLTFTFADGTTKTAQVTDRSITNVTASQVGAVVTLTFHMTDGTTHDVTFTASGSGGATITAGQGILVTGSTLTGYTVAVDTSFVATRDQIYTLDGRVTAAEAQVNILSGEVTAAVSQINSNTARIITAENEIDVLTAKIGSSVSPGTIIKRLDDLEDAEVVVDTSSYSTAPGHVPQSSLVNSTKMDAATNTGTVGMILTRTARGAQWEAPATGLTMDTAMSGISTNPVQNKVIKTYVDNVDTLLSTQIDALEDEIGPETVSGTVRYDIAALQTGKQNAALVTAFQTTPDDTHYPSEKLVFDRCVKLTNPTFTPETVAGFTVVLGPYIVNQNSVKTFGVGFTCTGALNEVKIGSIDVGSVVKGFNMIEISGVKIMIEMRNTGGSSTDVYLTVSGAITGATISCTWL